MESFLYDSTKMSFYNNDEIWKPVRLHDAESIVYLNELLAEGWYLMEVGVDGLKCLAFQVPLEPPKERKSGRHKRSAPAFSFGEFQVPRSPSSPIDFMPVVILTKGKDRGKQMALVAYRDETGYIDFTKTKADTTMWRLLLTMPVENGLVILYERK